LVTPLPSPLPLEDILMKSCVNELERERERERKRERKKILEAFMA
jgi:hypothetical protein